jgi:hypothetical protein
MCSSLRWLQNGVPPQRLLAEIGPGQPGSGQDREDQRHDGDVEGAGDESDHGRSVVPSVFD